MALRRGIGAALAGLGGVTAFRYRSVVQRQGQLPRQTLSVFDNNLKASRQRVLIIGAGVVGVSTAYKLAQRGHEVVILVRLHHILSSCHDDTLTHNPHHPCYSRRRRYAINHYTGTHAGTW